MARLNELGLTLRDVDLGGIDAESDIKLDEYFVTTPYVRSALNGRHTLFLGRKGSGKSALFRQLPRLVQEETGGTCVVLAMTPDQYAWAALKEYKEQGLLAEQAHTNAWKLTLAVEVAGKLLSLDRDWLPRAEEAVAKLRKFLTDNFGTVQPGLVSTATSIVRGLKSFNFSAFGFGAGLTKDVPEQALTPAVSQEVFKLIAVLLEEQSLLVGIDRLDDSWDGSAEAHSLLVGLLKATKDLNDSLGVTFGDAGLRIVVFLRSDIYDALRFDDKDKHRATEQAITWTPELLQEMIERRLPPGMTVDDFFEPGDMRGSISPFNYIVKRTFLRPREVLQFVEECLRQAGPEGVQVSKNDIRSAEERYSRWKVADLKQEFFKVFQDFDRLLECLRQEVHRYDAPEDLVTILRLKAPDLVEIYGPRSLLEILFDYSVIGVRLGDAGSTRFKAEDSELALPLSGAVYVHQSLYKGLNIRETRRAAEEPVVGSLQDRISVELYAKMLSALPMQDLAFLSVQPTPVAVFENESFYDCAKSLNVDLSVDEDGSRTSTIARPNIIAQSRFDLNSNVYVQLRKEMTAIVIASGLTVAEYVRAERTGHG